MSVIWNPVHMSLQELPGSDKNSWLMAYHILKKTIVTSLIRVQPLRWRHDAEFAFTAIGCHATTPSIECKYNCKFETTIIFLIAA